MVFGVITTLIMAAGQSSLVRIIFEMEQMIEFHKYLNLEIPVYFKEFLEELSVFKFLDLTVIIPYDIIKPIQDISTF